MIRRLKNFLHFLEAVAANIWYDFPSRKMIVVGVTGTDGKTTTTSLIYHILKKSGKKAAMITSVGAYIGDKIYDIGFHVTTPSSFPLQKYIKKALDLGNKYLVLEVTSHSLDQNRVAGIKFDIGVLTNITGEHLDYHKTYKNYVATKAKLLKMAKVAVVNRDDGSFGRIKLKTQNSKLKTNKNGLEENVGGVVTYGMRNNSDVNPKSFPFKTNLEREFSINKHNFLAAIAAVKTLGLSDASIKKAILTFKLPTGRQEIVYDKDFRVMIDFAHTPNAFEQVLPEARKTTWGRLIHVFGSAGERDAKKRPIMGGISAKYSDVIVLTAEDPRSESVEKIMEEIEKGMTNSKLKTQNSKPSQIWSKPSQIWSKLGLNSGNWRKGEKYLFKIPDRREAIEFAISIAQKKDLVILTGKGHEKSMNYGKGEEPWDEFEAVKQAIKKKMRQKS